MGLIMCSYVNVIGFRVSSRIFNCSRALFKISTIFESSTASVISFPNRSLTSSAVMSTTLSDA